MIDMAFGITRNELNAWKRKIDEGEIAFLTIIGMINGFPITMP